MIQLIAKQIFAYASYLNKAKPKIQNMLLNNTLMFFHNFLSFNSYEYWDKYFKNKHLKFNQLNDEQKKMLKIMVDQLMNALQESINYITNDMNEKTWILKNFINGTYIPDEDDQKYKELLDLFNIHKRKKEIVKKDIKLYSSYSELYNQVYKYTIKQNVYQYAKKYCKKICSHGIFECYKVINYQQGKVLFSNSGWCVKGKEYFQEYGAPYYLVFKNQERFALIHFDSNQCKDLSDHAVDPYTSNDFIKMLGVLFETENNGEFLTQQDFEDYQYLYIKYCDQIDNLIESICYVIDESDWQSILNILKILNDKNKLVSLLQTNSQLNECLTTAIKYNDFDKSDYQNLIGFLIANEIKLQYPDSAIYIAAESDNVNMWSSFWKNNLSENFNQQYDDVVLSTYNILKYQIDNGYQISIFDIEKIKYVLNDYTYLIDSISGVEKFLKMFDYWQDQLQELCQQIKKQLDLNQQQQYLLDKYCQKIKAKKEFDNYPNLPGLQQYMK